MTSSSPQNLTANINMATASASQQAEQQPTMPRRLLAPRANCTHIVMDYLYTRDIVCDNCHRPPPLGFLFICHQDTYSEATAHQQMGTLNSLNDKEQLPTRFEELKACGMSRSILEQIKQGNIYDQMQIQVLQNQKVHMLRVMDRQLSAEHEPWNLPAEQVSEILAKAHGGDDENSLHRNVTMRSGARAARAATSKLIQKLGHFRKRSQVIPKCGFKCCSTCRPYLKDRAFVSLEAAVKDEVEPERFLNQLRPVSDVFDASNLGLRPIYRKRFYATQQDTSDDSTSYSSSEENGSEYDLTHQNSAWQPPNHSTVDSTPSSKEKPASYAENLRRRFVPPGLYDATRSKDAEREAREAAETTTGAESPDSLMKRLARTITPNWLPPRSKSQTSLVPTLPKIPLRNAKSHHARLGREAEKTEEEHPESADLGLQTNIPRAKSHVDLPAVINLPPRANDEIKSRLDGYDQQDTSHNDIAAPDEEVAVEGGLALTEEAVETHIPDIITQV